MKSRKTPTTEKKHPDFKPKPKKETYEVKQPDIHFFMEIPYVLIGKPGFETPYAVDEKGIISYELTAVLRKLLDNQTDS